MRGASLIILSTLLSICFVWAFGRLSNQRAIRDTNRRIAARMYELRMFADEPRLIWNAQMGLFRDSLRRIGLILWPTAILAIPMLLVLAQFDALYGVAPAKPGQPLIITAQLESALQSAAEPPRLHLPNGFAAETPPVRSILQHQVSWRVQPTRAASGLLRIETAGPPALKTITSEPGAHYLSKRRASSIIEFLESPTELPMFHPRIVWIDVEYPSANVRWFGVELHWLVWFAIVMALVWVVWKPARAQ